MTVDSIQWTSVLEVPNDSPTPSVTSGTAIISRILSPGDAIDDNLFVTLNAPAAPQNTPPENRVATFTVTGTFHLRNGHTRMAHNLICTGEMLLPELPQLKVSSQTGRYDGNATELNFTISIMNPNPFSLPIDSLQYDLFVDDIALTHGNLSSRQQISAGGQLDVEVHRFVNSKDLPALATRLSKAKGFTYRLEGLFRTDEDTIPVHLVEAVQMPHERSAN